MYINVFIVTPVAVSLNNSLLADQVLAYVRALHLIFVFLIFGRRHMAVVVMSMSMLMLMFMVVVTILSQKSMRVA
jgi:hypothetical protein